MGRSSTTEQISDHFSFLKYTYHEAVAKQFVWNTLLNDILIQLSLCGLPTVLLLSDKLANKWSARCRKLSVSIHKTSMFLAWNNYKGWSLLFPVSQPFTGFFIQSASENSCGRTILTRGKLTSVHRRGKATKQGETRARHTKRWVLRACAYLTRFVYSHSGGSAWV